jgi:hypothetical protein
VAPQFGADHFLAHGMGSFHTVGNLARQIIFSKVKYSLDKRISDRYYMAQLDENFLIGELKMRDVRFSVHVVECSAVNWYKRDEAGAGVIEPYWEVRLEKHQYIKLAELFFDCASKESAETLALKLASAIQESTSSDVPITGLENPSGRID